MTCQMCGAGPDDLVAGRRVRLEVDHIVPKDVGGTDDPSNLRVLCNVCNAGAKDGLPPPRSRLQVLSVVRQANQADQVAVLAWLKRKFEGEP